MASTSLVGTPPLLRASLRYDGRMLAPWALLTTLLSASSMLYPLIFPTDQDRQAFAAAVGANPAMAIIFGPAFDLSTADGFNAWRAIALGGLIAALGVIFGLTRATRAQEDSGQAELLASGVMGRAARLMSAVWMCLGFSVVLGLVTGLVTVLFGGGWNATFLIAATMTATAWMFTGVAAVAAQVGSDARTSNCVEPLIATAIARHRYYLSNVIIALAAPAVYVVVAGVLIGWLAGSADIGVTFGDVVWQAVATIPAVWTVIALAVAVVGARSQVTLAAWVGVLASFALTILGPTFKLWDWILAISPFWHVPNVTDADADWSRLVWISVVTVLFLAVGFAGRAIIQAAREFLTEGDGDELTLTQIAARAGYSRRAVHANFTDLAGIIRAVTLDALALPETPEPRFDEALPREDLRRRVLAVLTQVQAERDVLLRIAELSSHPALTDALGDVVGEVLDRGRAGMGLTGLDELRTAFLVGGFVRVLRDWIRGTLPGTPEELADTALDLITVVTDAR